MIPAGPKGFTQPDPERSQTAEALYLAALALIILAANLPLFFGKTYQDLGAFTGDYFFAVTYGYNHLGDALRQGWFLLWGSGMGCGELEQAVIISGFTYPFAILFGLFHFPWHQVLFYVAHFELIGIFSFMLFRRLSLSRPASLLTAGWNATIGYTVWISQIPPVLAPLPWFYLIVGLCLKPKELHRPLNFLSLVFAFTMMLLSGDPEATFYAGCFGGLWLLCFWVLNDARLMVRTIALIAVGFVLAFILSLDQLLPSWNLISRTLRSGKAPFQVYAASYFSLPFLGKAMVGLFTRKFLDLYFSLFAFGFAVWGFLKGGKSPARRASIFVLVVIILILALPAIGLAKIVYHIPIYSHFIRHYRLAYIVQFVILTLAGMGVDRFLKSIRADKKSRDRALIIFSVLCLAGFAVSGFNPLLLLPLLLALAGRIFASFRKHAALIAGLLLLMDVLPYLWHPPYKFFEFKRPEFSVDYLQTARESLGKSRMQVFYPGMSILNWRSGTPVPIMVSGFAGDQGFDYYMSFPLREYAKLLALINPSINKPAKSFADIFNFSLPFKAQDYINPRNRHLLNMVGLRWLFLSNFALSETDRRGLIYDPNYFLNPALKNPFGGYKRADLLDAGSKSYWLRADAPARFDYQSSFSKGDALKISPRAEKGPAWFAVTSKGSQEKRLLFARRNGPKESSETVSVAIPPATDALSLSTFEQGGFAGWIEPQILNPRKTIRYVKGSFPEIYENIEALPRGWIVHEAFLSPDLNKLSQIMADPQQFNPAQKVLISSRIETTMAATVPAGGRREPVNLEEYRDEFVRLQTSLSDPGWLLWMDQYYPGWEARVDGKPARIFRANLCFRAVQLAPGVHEVIFRFHPADFRIGLYFSFVSWMLLAGLVCVAVIQRIRSSS